MKSILVPSDFSAPSREAFEFASEIASRTNGEIIVLHAIYSPLMYDPYYSTEPTLTYNIEISSEIVDRAKEEFDNMIQNSKRPEVPIKLEIIYGDVIAAIKQATVAREIDLIVMGTSGSSGWKELLIGSTTEKMVRHSPVPVLAVKTAPAFSSIKKILLPSSLSLELTAFMDKVKELQDFFDAELHVVRINTPLNFKPDAEVTPAMEKFAGHYKLRNYFLHAVNNWNEEQGILDFVREKNMDMIAMGTHSRRGLAHLFNGSIAEDVVNHLTCPVWTYSIRK